MSIQAVGFVLDHSRARLAARLVLLSIANHADKRGGNACPGYQTIGEEAGVDRRHSMRCAEQLRNLGELVVVRSWWKGKLRHFYFIVGMPAATELLASNPQFVEKGLIDDPVGDLVQFPGDNMSPRKSLSGDKTGDISGDKTGDISGDKSDAHKGGTTEPLNHLPTNPVPATKSPALTSEVWKAYRAAYLTRYGVEPTRNGKVNGQLAQVVKRLGVAEAPSVAAFFVSHNDAYYVRRAHQVDCLLADAEKLRTEWATGRKVNAKSARDQENLEGNGAFQLLAERKRRAGTDR